MRRHLHAADMVAGIDEVNPPALPRLLVAIALSDCKERIVTVGARAADGANGALSGRELALVLIALAYPRAVEGDHGVIPSGQIDLHAH